MNIGTRIYALPQMIGPVLNAAGIVLGSLFGLLKPARLSPAQEGYLKVGLAVLTVFYGLRLTWLSFSGSLGQVLKQIVVMIVAMMMGRLLGRLLSVERYGRPQWCKYLDCQLP